MDGYLIRIPYDAWLGDRQLGPSSRSKRASKPPRRPAELLYYELGEGFLRGYAAPNSDAEPVDEFQLTSFHVTVDPMYSMFMFEVCATLKTPRLMDARAVVVAKLEDDSSDDNSDDSSDDSSDDDSPSRSEPTEKSILLFAATPKLVEKWCSRVLNWNRYVFGSAFSDAASDSDGLSAEALEASRLELLEAFENHRHAAWFSRSLALKISPSSSRSSVAGQDVGTRDASASPTPPDVFKSSANGSSLQPPPKPWWTFPTSQTRRISSTSVRR
ncbi:hypothetical protein PybrP1_001339 [[Pythium] brassicae (nom. inval.)]|nr:hypothetical protein PybrP1_001339 [[Pythium] brassicae (nom. inval.)]